MELLTGEFRNTLDDKGRISLPAKLRGALSSDTVVITRGRDKCLWVFTPERWDVLSEKVFQDTGMFTDKAMKIQRLLIAPAQEVEIDKAGRVAIPQSLRLYAGLNKDCVVLGITKRLEIWDLGSYDKWVEDTEEDFESALENLDINL